MSPFALCGPDYAAGQRSWRPPSLTKYLAEKADRCIAAAGHYTALLTRLAVAERSAAELQRQIDTLKMPDIRIATAEVRDYVTKACLDMRSLFCQTYGVARAKHELAKHMTQLVLTPKETPDGWHYEVEGDWELLPHQKSAIWMVARDGSEQNYVGPSVNVLTILRR